MIASIDTSIFLFGVFYCPLDDSVESGSWVRFIFYSFLPSLLDLLFHFQSQEAPLGYRLVLDAVR
jgi:hypothetical protein